MNSIKANKRIFLSPPHMSGREMRFVQAAFESNYIAPLGPQVDAFEKEFSSRTGFPYTLATSSGTAALHLALHCLGIGRGDYVIVPSLTFIGGVSPIIFQGAVPVFIDSEPASWNMDPDLLAEELKRLNHKNKLPKAVITADIYGQSVDLARILATCKPYNIPVISDSAEALGATYQGGSVGLMSRVAVFSFNGNKIITTSGGGMLASRDEALIDQARILSQQARDPAPHYQHSQIGYNYRLSNVLAAIGMAQLGVLDERVENRRRIFDYYKESLSHLPGVKFMPEAPYGSSSRWLSVILINPEEFGADKETVRLALEIDNIESRPVWKPMHLQPVFKGCRSRGGAVSEDLFKRGLCLPSGSAMTVGELERVVEGIVDVAKNFKGILRISSKFKQPVWLEDQKQPNMAENDLPA